ncbi:MAG TPA: 1,4-dihydroxy-2-naphthoyl-CoA synthase [Dehalococcoidia bacterium]|nr:1,4-dihydroxy-2-naphthoyl-CoA synthase [Dehalococcoidia bacterium]
MEFEDILYHKKDGVAKIIINRPQVYNAFRTKTVEELYRAFQDAEMDPRVGVVVLTGAGEKAFCAGGDVTEVVDGAGYTPELLYWDVMLHRIIRFIPKPVIAAVNGICLGGGNVFATLCDITIAAETARFGQVGPKVGSFDAGFGAAYLQRLVGAKRAREMWFLCRQYSAQEALEMGLVNKVVPPDKLEEEVDHWCQELLARSPTAIKFLKAAMNADSDAIHGIENIWEQALQLYYQGQEALEGRRAFMEKRKPDWDAFRK